MADSPQIKFAPRTAVLCGSRASFELKNPVELRSTGQATKNDDLSYRKLSVFPSVFLIGTIKGNTFIECSKLMQGFPEEC